MSIVLITPEGMPNSPERVGSLRNKIGPNVVLDNVAAHQSRYNGKVDEAMLNGMHYVLETAIDGDFFWAYPDFVQLLSVVPPNLLDQEVLICDVLAKNQKGDYVNMPNVLNFTLNASMLIQSLRAGKIYPACFKDIKLFIVIMFCTL